MHSCGGLAAGWSIAERACRWERRCSAQTNGKCRLHWAHLAAREGEREGGEDRLPAYQLHRDQRQVGGGSLQTLPANRTAEGPEVGTILLILSNGTMIIFTIQFWILKEAPEDAFLMRRSIFHFLIGWCSGFFAFLSVLHLQVDPLPTSFSTPSYLCAWFNHIWMRIFRAVVWHSQ